mmetsp:Transcript_28450/g.41876  ORF Transcript_28450/g.41876 Transcript_28450/m.41876 type:complete len:169 (+) Transcript_28450:111-617(+)
MPRKTRWENYISAREKGFDVSTSQRPEYNALHDKNMRRYFENEAIQDHLWRTGQIDRMGRVIDLEKNKSKLRIIEKEFSTAEKKEVLRRKEEDEWREMVTKLRMQQLEGAQKMKKIHQLKQDRIINEEITAIAKEAFGISDNSTKTRRVVAVMGKGANQKLHRNNEMS